MDQETEPSSMCYLLEKGMATHCSILGIPWGLQTVKNVACNAGDLGLIPGLGRYPGKGNGLPLQYSCLENSMDKGTQWAIAHGIMKVSDMFSSVAQSCLTLCNPMDCSTSGLPVHHKSWSLFKLTSIELVMPSNHLILCCRLLLLPSIFPSIRVFSNESVPRIRWPKYQSFRFNISPSNEYSGLISFRMDWLDLLAVQRTLKSLLQHYSSKG